MLNSLCAAGNAGNARAGLRSIGSNCARSHHLRSSHLLERAAMVSRRLRSGVSVLVMAAACALILYTNRGQTQGRNAESVSRALAEIQSKHAGLQADMVKKNRMSNTLKEELQHSRNEHARLQATNEALQRELEGAQRVHTPRYRINVFVNLRLHSLRRLCRSLLAAKITERVSIVFLMEAGQPEEVHDYVYKFSWTHGDKHIVARHSKGGLINAIVESWYPTNDDEWIIFLEDDIEVSPYFLEWLNRARAVCGPDSQCIGVSLYSPMLNELVKPKKSVTKKLEGPAYLAQIPCSWGAAYKPHPWRMFRRWVQFQDRGRYSGDLDLAMASGWAASWKRYLLELMLVMDWFVLYPFIDDGHAAYSTNHLEVGEHIKTKNDSDHRAEHYTFPLLQTPPPELASSPTLRFDHLYFKILDITDALVRAAQRTVAPRTREKDTACIGYNQESHTYLVTEGLTIVMGHFYTRTRYIGFLRNVLTYCDYGDVGVKRIVVVWHNKRIKPPTMATCPGQGVHGTTVHFLAPAVADTLSNRFTPTYRIRTDIVVTVDDDIIVTARDLDRMAKVLRAQGLQRVVSPFPRWYDAKGNYLWLPNIPHLEPAAFTGYPFVLTKLHLSHYVLYNDYYCKEEYEEGRKLVRSARNGEDILYMRAAADRAVKPALYIVTVDPVYDTGVQGLHNRSSHNRDRSTMVRLCKFNASNWANEIVHSPGTELNQYKHADYVDTYKSKLVECGDCAASHNGKQLPNFTDPFIAKLSTADPHCATGIHDSKGVICCMTECGQCGGGRCDLRPGGSEGCCGGIIRTAGKQCSEYGPPCVMS
eukprot:m.60300 g.60300  ORF g.60300 m.60300 type:complete len:816 (+) comp9500_c0_seq2:207-2654(+)